MVDPVDAIGTKTAAVLAGIVGTALGVLITFSTTVSQQQAELAAISERVSAIDSRLASLTSDQYRGVDATRDFRLADQRIAQNAAQITELRAMFERHLRTDHHVELR